MTTLMARPGDGDTLWSSMPGWGIVADLTPPELVESRRLKVLRKIIVVCLGVVLVLCAAGFVLAYSKSSSASDTLDAATARTTQLTAEQQKYANVTRIQNATKSIESEIATLMVSDVDTAALLSRLRAAMPGSMSLTSANVTFENGAPGTSATTQSLDTSGQLTIGTVTLNGTSQTLTDLATYVRTLTGMRGVVNVVPGSNTSAATGPGGGQWTVTLQVTDQLYTHRYDATTAPGGK